MRHHAPTPPPNVSPPAIAFAGSSTSQRSELPSDSRILFHQPTITGRELPHIADAINRSQVGEDGFFTRACTEFLQDRFSIDTALMVNSCTAALEMAMTLCGVSAGDEVIMPSFTFVSCANAVVKVGATPVFVDVRADTMNLDESLIEAAITERTRAIMPVHYAGVSCEMDAICAIAAKHGLRVIEDAAQGVNSTYKGRPLGSIGDLAGFSFHDTKNISCGEGGALCINDSELVERAEILRDKGTNRRQFWRGQVDKYTWVDVGSSYVLSEISCAYLYGQLESLDEIQKARDAIYNSYREQLAPLAAEGKITLANVPADCTTNSHIFYLMVGEEHSRADLMDHLRARNVATTFHFVPLHTSPMGTVLGRASGDLPVTTDQSARLLRLPMHLSLDEADIERVVSAVEEFFQ